MYRVNIASRGTKGALNIPGTVMNTEPVDLEGSDARALQIDGCSLPGRDRLYGRRLLIRSNALEVSKQQLPASVVSHGNASGGFLLCA